MRNKIKSRIKKLLSAETGTVFKDPGGRINIVLAYPNLYRVGMSNLGFQGIYGWLNSLEHIVCERVFLPEPDDMDVYRESGTPLMSLESMRPIREFHLVAFSASFENDYPAVPRMLDLAGIPRRASGRGPGDPLLLLGGICAAYNPEPLADFFDVVFIGEAEASLPAFMDLIKQGPEDRSSILHEAARIEGVYIPSLYEERYDGPAFVSKLALSGAPLPVKRGQPADLDESAALKSVINTPGTEFSRMGLVEAMRGCPWSCRFCVASKAYSPVRYRKPARLEELFSGLAEVFPRVGLVGPSLSEYRGIENILESGKVDFSVSSLRAWKRSAELVKVLASRGQKSVSIAPEAGTERMRRVINKNISEEDIMETAGLILAEGIQQLRLYFMVGLPTETEEDVKAIGRLGLAIRGLSKRGRVILSVSSFVPKPFTPFQWMAMSAEKSLRDRLSLIKAVIRGSKGISMMHEAPGIAVLEGFLSRGDRRTSRVLELMADGKGWKRAAAELGIEPGHILHRSRPFGEALPWDFIDPGFPRQILEKECEKAMGEACAGRGCVRG